MNYFAQSKGDELIMAATGRLIVMLAAEVVGYATLIRAALSNSWRHAVINSYIPRSRSILVGS
jgi:hypothetical protein